MKKIFTILMVSLAVFSLNAQVFTEYFEGATLSSPLEGYNGWIVSPKASEANGTSPIINFGLLTYPGYAGSEIGNVVVIASIVGDVSATQRISTKKIQLGENDLTNVVGEKIYAAFLVNVSINSKKGAVRDFFNFEGSETSSMTRGRVFAKIYANGDVTFGITKNNTTVTESSVFYTDATYLLVMVYEGVEGESNDILTLYINPDLSKAEAEQTNQLVAADAQTDYSASAKLGINIRQRGIGAQIGGIRVGKSWDAVTKGTTTSVLNKPDSDRPMYSFQKTIITNETGWVKVYNLAGAEVLSSFSNGFLETTLDKGLYLVKFTSQRGNGSVAKLVIQ